MNNTKNTTNRLINEKSPYLLQHAHNPVDWYPWCEEAFTKAKNEDKPIFLSIGYSTCHWCHVMENESFEDEEVAHILNNKFVSIKVDREERPDIDTVYMNVCQMITGQGGWPLSIFMDSEKKPFYAGTYFPKYSYSNIIGFIELLERISEMYKINKEDLVKTQKNILEILNNNKKELSYVLDFDVINKAFTQLSYAFDKEYGGFYHAPKFPMPHNLIFLMYYYHLHKNKVSLNMAEETLLSMYKGGIYDHIGGGFCRYSTDNKWLLPHFEKMLYDNALITISYCILYSLTKKKEYSEIINHTLCFVLKELRNEKGGFFSAVDADSEGVEGKFYVWSKKEIDKLLTDDSEFFCSLYNITENGNFDGYNIPNLIGNNIKDSHTELIKRCKTKLFNEREKRIRPFLDDKILSGWNGLIIAALSMAGKLLGNDEYITAAKNSADFIINNMITSDNFLYTSFREDKLSNKAVSESYSYVIWGLIELYEVTLETKYLINAKNLNNRLINNFWDYENGGLFLNDKDGEALITRPKEMYDNAIPSANSVSCYNFIRLSHILHDKELEEKARDILKYFMADIKESPANYSFGLLSMLYLSSEGLDIVLYGGTKEEFKEYLELINNNYNSFCTILYIDKDTEKISEIFEHAKNYYADKPTMQICKGSKCSLPITDINSLKYFVI